MNRVYLAGVCAIAGFLVGLVSSNSLMGQQVPRPPEASRAGKYQLSTSVQGAALNLYFLDTETGQLWGGQSFNFEITWRELGSPVRPVPKKK